MSCNEVINVRGITKTYEIYARPQDRLKQLIRSSLGRVLGLEARRFYREHRALDDISISVKRGESIGIIGRNGSGKSTLLQIICGTLAATHGEVRTKGRIAALLELGAGFNPEFTGRENAALTGQLMGLSHREISTRMDEVEAFADIGEFFDRPVKTYSSGMYVRVAFAASMLSQADILIVDEALAVGDHFFQARCFHALQKMSERGATLLFVSHSLATVKAICQRALVLDKGSLIFDGSVDEAADRYLSLYLGSSEIDKVSGTESGASNAVSEHQTRSLVQPSFESRITARSGDGRARFTDCLILQDGREVKTLVTDRPATIRAVLHIDEEIAGSVELGVVVSTIEGVELFALNSARMREAISDMRAGSSYICDFDFHVALGTPRTYRIDLGMRAPVQGAYADKVFCAAIFEVHSGAKDDVSLLFNVPAELNLQQIPENVG